MKLAHSSAKIAVFAICLLTVPAFAQSQYDVLYRFALSGDGASPQSSIVFDRAGNLYGVTTFGGNVNGPCGSQGCGTVFQLKPSGTGWTEKIIYAFSGSGTNDGEFPVGGLVIDSAGNLVGTTNGGGTANRGTAFKLSPSKDGSWTESVLWSFGSVQQDGINPVTTLTLDATGNLYGVTPTAGSNTGGIVFELQPKSGGGWTETILHRFGRGSDGSNPYANLIFDKHGNLYGTTYLGGTSGAGTIYELKSTGGTWSESVLYSFDGGDAGNPGMIAFDTSGNLYGAFLGGTNTYGNCGLQNKGLCGGIFKFSPPNAYFLTLDRTNGGQPDGGVVVDSKNHRLFAVSLTEPAQNDGGGSVIELEGKPVTVSILYQFCQLTGCYEGSSPSGPLTARNGKLYGVSTQGGEGGGLVFEITP